MSSEPRLDAYDLRILETLTQDGRISWRDLGDRIGLSLTPTLRRVRRMEAEGTIQGYGARLDESRLAGAISVFVSVTLTEQTEEAIRRFEAEIVTAPEVMDCFLMTGGADYMLRVATKDLFSYQSFLLNRLTRVPGVSNIRSSFALRAVVKRNGPPL